LGFKGRKEEGEKGRKGERERGREGEEESEAQRRFRDFGKGRSSQNVDTMIPESGDWEKSYPFEN